MDHHDPDNMPTDPVDDMNEGEVKADTPEPVRMMVENMTQKFPRMVVTFNPSTIGFRDERMDCGVEFVQWLTTAATTLYNDAVWEERAKMMDTLCEIERAANRMNTAEEVRQYVLDKITYHTNKNLLSALTTPTQPNTGENTNPTTI